MSGHISPGLLHEINHKYFNIYGSVHGSDRQGTRTGLLRTGPTVRSKVRYMVRTEPRVQFSVLQISLWTWPNRTLTTLTASLNMMTFLDELIPLEVTRIITGWTRLRSWLTSNERILFELSGISYYGLCKCLAFYQWTCLMHCTNLWLSKYPYD